MQDSKITFENLIKRAEPLFYSVWIDEATPQECEYWRQYFNQYPNKGDYKTMYEKALKKCVKILYTSWYYETPHRISTPEQFLQIIEQEESEIYNA